MNMGSILRSSKFVRYIAGFARHVVNTPREFDGNLVNTAQCYCNATPRYLVTQTSTHQDQTLEKSLQRIDQDVRRSGRISRRDIEDVLEEIRTSRSATSSQSLLVIRCCGNLVPEELPETRTKLVQEIWNTLLKLNVPMDVSHYNALLRVYLENEHPFSPTEFLSQMEAKGIEPNRVTYQRLIARYCQLGDIEGATKILEFMRQKQLPVNENVFNTLIMGHSQAGDMKSAHGILSVMAQAGLEPSADTYTTLLCGYAKTGDMEKIEEVLQECVNKDVYLLDKDYLDIVYALATNGHEQHIPTVLNKVRKAFGYNQEAINLILRLVNKDLDGPALHVLKSMTRNTRADGTLQPTGHFIIRQMVKAQRPISKIIEMCDLMANENLYENGLLLALESSLELHNADLSYQLMEELQKRGQEIRHHFFWPLIAANADDPTGNGIINVLLTMNKFGVSPNAETLRDYVIPNLNGTSSEIISQLRQANISLGSSACHLVHFLLLRGDMQEAAIIISRVPAYYSPQLLKRPLTNAFYKKRDFKSYITILRYIYENLDRRDSYVGESEDLKPLDKSEQIGQFILDLATNRREFPQVIDTILEELVKKGLSLNAAAAEKIQEDLGEKLTHEISTNLGKLASGELVPEPVQLKAPVYTPAEQMNIPQLERLIQNLSAQNKDVTGLQRQLLNLYCRAKEVAKVETLLKDLEGSSFTYTAGVYAQLTELYAFHENLEMARTYLTKLKEVEPDFVLDDLKVIRLVQVLVKNNHFDEAIELLNSQSNQRKDDEQRFSYTALCWRLLNSLAEEKRVEDLEKMFNTLVDLGYIQPNNVMLGPFIKVHLLQDDIDKALEKFEMCCKQYRATPWKNEIACKLIEMEDAEKLQKLTDLSTLIHGEINSLYDLVFAFVECGRIRQARKILETPGLQTRPHRINSACQRYQMEGMVKSLEGLKDATKDLNHIDRSDIYYQLLLTYTKQDDSERAVGLWTQMQEEDLAPNDTFLYTLGTFLKERGENVPFAIPKIHTEEAESSQLNRPSKQSGEDLYLFKQAIQSGNFERALVIKNTSKERMPTVESSLLIEGFLQKENISEAVTLTINMLEEGYVPITRIFRFLLSKLAANGKVDELNMIGAKISNETKKLLSFDNKMCHANLVSGNTSNYLEQLTTQIENANDSDLRSIEEKFPRGGAFGILENHPELTEKFETMALKYAQRGIVSPVNVLWCHYFIQDDPKAEAMWEHLKQAKRVMFQRVVQYAREKSDENVIRRLISHLKSSTVTVGALGNAYSCLLDVVSNQGDSQKIISTFEDVLKDINIEFLNKTAVLRVKSTYETANKPFEYVVPSRNKQRSDENNVEEY